MPIDCLVFGNLKLGMFRWSISDLIIWGMYMYLRGIWASTSTLQRYSRELHAKEESESD